MSRLRRQAALACAVGLLGLHHQHARAESDSPAFSIPDGGHISTLTRSTFISSVLESSRPALVWLYAGSECPQCEGLLPAVEAAAGKLSSWGVSVAAVDVSKETKLRRDLSVPKGLPTMFKVYHSESTPNPYGGLPVRSEELIPTFQDARNLQKKVLSAIPDQVVSVDLKSGASGAAGAPSATLKAALADGDGDFAAVLFTDAGKASPVLRVLANEVKGKVTTVQARLPKRTVDDDEGEGDGEDQSAEGILKGFLEGVIDVQGTVASVPAFVLVDKRSGKGSVFGGGAVDDAKAMLDFVRDGAGVSEADDNPEGADGSGDGEANKVPMMGGVLRLDPKQLKKLEEEGTEALFVAFVLDVENVDSYISGWDEAIKSFRGQIRAAVLDCSAYPAECSKGEGGKMGAPHVRVYPHGKGVDGDKRAFPTAFAFHAISQAVEEAEASLPDIVTVIPAGVHGQLVKETVESFVGSVVSGGGPMCLLVLSRREQPNLAVKTVSAAFQEANIKTLFISNPDDDVLNAVGVFQLPAMALMFPEREGMRVDPDSRPPPDGQKAVMTAKYNPALWGAVTHEHVSEFIMSHLSSVDTDAYVRHVRSIAATAKLNGERMPVELERSLPEFRESEQDTGFASSPRGGDDRPADTFQGVPEANAQVWATLMGGGDGGGGGSEKQQQQQQPPMKAVGVFFLDRFSDGFATALEAAEAAAELAADYVGVASAGVGFVWADAPCQEAFARTLGVSDPSEVPALAVFFPKRKMWNKFVGAWESDSLGSFLGRALVGRAPLFPIDNAPRLDESVDCSQRPAPTWMTAGGDGGDAVEDEDMEDLMAEILAEEAKAKRELEEEVARSLQEQKGAEEAEVAPKRTKKTVKKRKKKKKKSSDARTEL